MSDQTVAETVERVLQRFVLPTEADPDVLPLYVDTSAPAVGDDDSSVKPGETLAPGQIEGRHRLRLDPADRVSLCTYFNAFPAGYWRRWTVVDEVKLTVEVSGEGASLTVFRSMANGRSQWVQSEIVEGESATFEFDLPLKAFGDGGWYWFDLVAGNEEAHLEGATWTAQVPADRATPGSTTIGITTMNRPDFCAKVLGQLAEDPVVLDLLDEVIVAEQGTDKVVDSEFYHASAEALGGRLRVLEQGNLGGSGGFARAQLETLKAGRSKYVLFLDDDIILEPESVLRAVTFGDLARTPTVVGGHMFSLYARSRLHSFGEIVQPWRFWWQSPHYVKSDWDLGHRNLRNSRWLHRRVDVDFTPWFFCLIPTQVVEEIGLSLPIFIKWDDLEYGLRAKRAGYPVVTFPGAAVWHVPWTDKNDALDWQAYFHQRNRLIAGLLHSEFPRGGKLVEESFTHQMKHLVSMQYSVVEMRHQALLDVLAGPEGLHEALPHRLADIRAMRSEYPDAQLEPHPEVFPAVKRKRPSRSEGEERERYRLRHLLLSGAATAVRQVRQPTELSREHPEASVPAVEAKWYKLGKYDSAVVSMPDGSSVALYQRDREQAKALAAKTVAIHRRLLREWPSLAERYRRALPEITSPESWERTFAPWMQDDDAEADSPQKAGA